MKQTNKLIKYTAVVMAMITIVAVGGVFSTAIIPSALRLEQSAEAIRFDANGDIRQAPPAITGDNVYVAWWTNETANNNTEDVMFRASIDGGQTFSDQINLSNTTDSDSTRVEIDSDADSVVVTWWETNQTATAPVMRVSNDNGATFGSVLTLATNGTIGEAAEEEEG